MGHSLVTQFSRLTVRRGEPIRAEHHNNLVKLAQSLSLQRGAVKGRQYPDGWTPRIQVVQEVDIDCPWQGAIQQQDASTSLFTFTTTGTVAALVPVIGSTPIDQLDSNNQAPQLKVDASAFAQYGNAMRGLLLFKLTYDHATGYAQKVEVVALATMPAVAGLASGIAYKLAGFLINAGGNVSYNQQCFFNLGWNSPAWFWAE